MVSVSSALVPTHLVKADIIGIVQQYRQVMPHPQPPNSQLIALTSGEQVFELTDKVFSPDGDGYQDILSIEYKIPQEGMFATIKIFDSAGRLTRVLINNASLATTGLITWDGTNEDGHKANIGIYTILLEAFNLQGTQIRWKETCVVAGRLD